MFTAGDILELSYKHPTLGAGTWFPKSNEDGNLDPGGYRKEDDANMTTGDGQPIRKLNRVLGSLELTISWDMNLNNLADAEKIAANPLEADWTVTHINGTVWGGKGTIVGDVVGNTNTATFPIKLSVIKWDKIG